MGLYLLDTHTPIWLFNGDDALSKTAKQLILDVSNSKYLSIASAWELAIKAGLGKIDFAGKSAGFLRLAEANGFIILPIKTSHLTTYESLPFIHRDPFDRLFIASAIAEQMTLITADENIARYDVPHIW
jgi:PIN domain nuclease of toxin-antitoxin system